MGFFNELKKLFFVQKAVAKSQGQKVVEKGKEAGGQLIDKADDLASQAKEVVKHKGENSLIKPVR